MKLTIKAANRGTQGTGASRRLRRESKVPAILYGATEAPTMIEIDHKELYLKLKQEAFHASILDMELNGATQQVLLRDFQMHPFRQIVLHADFQRVAADRKIHMKVPLHFINADIAPGVKQSGGLVSHVQNEIDVACLPKDLPEFIEVDLKDLQSGHSIHIRDLKLPEGVEAITHRGENPTVATIVLPRSAVAEEEAKPAVSAADVPAANQKAKDEAKDAKKDPKKDAKPEAKKK